MTRDLSHLDRRAEGIRRQFGDTVYNVSKPDIGQEVVVDRDDGRYVYRDLSTKDLLRILQSYHVEIQKLKQELNTVKGQLKYIADNGVDEYTARINEINQANPGGRR